MNSSSSTLTVAILIIAISLFSVPIYAFDDYEDDDSMTPVQRLFDSGELNPSPKLLRSTYLRALLNYRWQIVKIEKHQINAKLKHASLVVKFQDNLVVELSITPRMPGLPMSKWLRNIEKFVTKEFTFQYYNRQFGM